MTDAVEFVIDQCTALDDPARAVSTGPKATAFLVSGNAAPFAEAIFKNKRCRHPKGTHRPIRGTDDKGVYLTAGTEVYSSRLCEWIATVVKGWLGSLGVAVDRGEITAMVAGVLHGKRLPKDSVDGKFFHRIGNHSERRRLKHICEAWKDAEPWMVKAMEEVGPEESPCDACLKGEAPQIGPHGSLPDSPGLMYIDVWHAQVPGMYSGSKNRLGAKLVGGKNHFMSVAIKNKSDAPEAVELCLSYYNSTGNPISWIICDCAPELRSGGVGTLARKHSIRISTTVPGRGRTNAVEPDFRVMNKTVRVLLSDAQLPDSFHDYAFDYAQDGRALLPSREPPHQCPLGRLLGDKVNGTYRRPFGCLCYPTIAPRLPSGTLVNKVGEQSKRCLYFGYRGAATGAFERMGADKPRPGHICYDPVTNSEVVTDSVRCVAWCLPGLQRAAGGGVENSGGKYSVCG